MGQAVTNRPLATALALLVISLSPIRASAQASFAGSTPQSQSFDKMAYQREISDLQVSFAREVPVALHGQDDDSDWIARAQEALQSVHFVLDRAQLFVVVDRNSKVQQLRILAGAPDGEWAVIGASKVSTGKPGRKEHFKSPLGVFHTTTAILGYRALGTYNEHHIRGIGLKGERVWDLGWQTTEDWRHPGHTAEIRFEMHATDPRYLEPRMGRPDSEGCVRIPTAVNHFLDDHGILDADYEEAADEGDRAFQSILSKHLVRTPLAGDTLIVFDSSES